jgi:hypothetical protein
VAAPDGDWSCRSSMINALLPHVSVAFLELKCWRTMAFGWSRLKLNEFIIGGWIFEIRHGKGSKIALAILLCHLWDSSTCLNWAGQWMDVVWWQTWHCMPIHQLLYPSIHLGVDLCVCWLRTYLTVFVAELLIELNCYILAHFVADGNKLEVSHCTHTVQIL